MYVPNNLPNQLIKVNTSIVRHPVCKYRHQLCRSYFIWSPLVSRKIFVLWRNSVKQARISALIRGTSPYEHNDTVPFFSPYFLHWTDSGNFWQGRDNVELFLSSGRFSVTFDQSSWNPPILLIVEYLCFPYLFNDKVVGAQNLISFVPSDHRGTCAKQEICTLCAHTLNVPTQNDTFLNIVLS